MPTLVLLVAAVAALAGAPVGAAPKMLVVCAPGYPGSTLQAQATMDAFAGAVASGVGWPQGSLGAVYHETLQAGRERIGAPDTVLAIVTLPFLLQEGAALGLMARLQIVQMTGDSETWSLVAKRGALTSAAGLEGWEIGGGPAYAPAFVRAALVGWGAIPGSTRLTFMPAALAGLRRAAAGETIAMLLDAAGAAALASLPFAGDLEIVARSPKMPGSLLCTVRDRLEKRDADAVLKALERLDRSPAGAAALEPMRMTRFEPVDGKALDAAKAAYSRAAAVSHP